MTKHILADVGAIICGKTIVPMARETSAIAFSASSSAVPLSRRIHGMRPSWTIFTTSLNNEFRNRAMFNMRFASSSVFHGW